MHELVPRVVARLHCGAKCLDARGLGPLALPDFSVQGPDRIRVDCRSRTTELAGGVLVPSVRDCPQWLAELPRRGRNGYARVHRHVPAGTTAGWPPDQLFRP